MRFTDEDIIEQPKRGGSVRFTDADIKVRNRVDPKYLNVVDPTGGMSGMEKFLAGTGKAFVDLSRGARQLLPGDNTELDAEIAESRRLDAPLMKTGAGMAGNVTGNVAALAPAMFIPGVNTYAGAAVLGAGAGLLEPTVEGESKISNALMGAGAGVLGQGIGRGIGRLVRPVRPQLSNAQRELIRLAEREGIPIRASQATGSKPVAIVESVMENLPTTSGRQLGVKRAQQEAFTKATLKRAGIEAAEATPEILAAQKAVLGKTFEDIAERNSIDAVKAVDGKNLFTRLSEIGQNAVNELPPQEAARVGKAIEGILSQIDDAGHLAGNSYQGWRTPLGRLASSGTETGYHFGRVKQALDKTFSSQISKADAEAWKTASQQYGSLKTILDAMGGSAAPAGNITPAQLAAAATRSTGREGRALGRGALTELSKVGRAVVADTIPDSGTAQRLFYQKLLSGELMGAIPGAAYGYYQGGPEGAVLGVAGGMGAALVAPRILQSMMNSRAGQNYLARGILPLTENARNALATSGRMLAISGANALNE